MDDLILEAVRERDIDLLLVEELHASVAMQHLFLTLLFPEYGLSSESAWTTSIRHSVSGFDEGVSPGVGPADLMVRRGETDIELQFRVPIGGRDLRLVALIENKVDAGFTVLQPERYASRARRMVAADECDVAVTALMAPGAYLGGARGKGFDKLITFEELEEFFRRQANHSEISELVRRYEYRAGLLAQAIGEYRRSSATTVHNGISGFRQAYYVMVQEVDRELGMRQPKSSGQWAGDYWMEYYDALAPKPHVRGNIKHKCPEGKVDLHLSGWAEFRDLAAGRITPLLEDGMGIRTAGKSLAISVQVPAFNPQNGMEGNEEHALQGIRAASLLQQWYRKHRSKLEAIARELGLLG